MELSLHGLYLKKRKEKKRKEQKIQVLWFGVPIKLTKTDWMHYLFIWVHLSPNLSLHVSKSNFSIIRSWYYVIFSQFSMWLRFLMRTMLWWTLMELIMELFLTSKESSSLMRICWLPILFGLTKMRWSFWFICFGLNWNKLVMLLY